MTLTKVCERCQTPYHWEKSSSALKMTYCSILCEHGGLGFTIEGLLTMDRPRREPIDPEWLETLEKLGLTPDDVE